MDERDRGSSVVEFVLMATLLVFLLFAAMQVALYAYVQTVVASAAQDGARYGANEQIGSRAGAHRADAHMRGRLPTGHYPCTGRNDVDALSGLRIVTVHCRGTFRLVLIPLHLPLSIDVSASVVAEHTP